MADKQVHQSKEEEFITLDSHGNKKIHVDILLKTLIQHCMGKAIDYGRLSGMSERSFQQYERLIKDEFYNSIKNGERILKEFGYTTPKEK